MSPYVPTIGDRLWAGCRIECVADVVGYPASDGSLDKVDLLVFEPSDWKFDPREPESVDEPRVRGAECGVPIRVDNVAFETLRDDMTCFKPYDSVDESRTLGFEMTHWYVDFSMPNGDVGCGRCLRRFVPLHKRQ